MFDVENFSAPVVRLNLNYILGMKAYIEPKSYNLSNHLKPKKLKTVAKEDEDSEDDEEDDIV